MVGTPGRLLDLIKKRVLDLGRVSTVVLDEADEMLSMGFIKILKPFWTPPRPSPNRSFSATMPSSIRSLAKRYLRDPQVFTTGRNKLTVSTVEQRYYLINESDRTAALNPAF